MKVLKVRFQLEFRPLILDVVAKTETQDMYYQRNPYRIIRPSYSNICGPFWRG